MSKPAWGKLKSGSDVRGIAVAEPGAPATLTEDIGSALGVAFVRWLAQKAGKPAGELTVAVGRDSRVTGEQLAGAIIRGMGTAAGHVIDCGLCTTPAMFMSTVLLGCDGAVMVTASHLPWQRNGYKFFTAQGGLEGADISKLLADAAEITPVTQPFAAEKVDFLKTYTGFLRDMVVRALGADAPLGGMHIVVDAGNGAGGFYADLLASLGADTSGSQFLDPDGRFPNHAPNPEAPEAMQSLSEAVVRAGADLGVLFDADCDRAALVEASGKELNRNRLIALVSAVLLGETPGITVVTDSVVSAGLGAFIAAHGGVLHRFKRGYRNVIDEAIRLNGEGIDCPLAMETSGHAALRENRFLDDGMYLVTRLIIEAARLGREGSRLDALIADLEEPVEAAEIRLPILAESFRSAGEAVIQTITAAAKRREGMAIDPDNREGIRVLFGAPEEWVLLRVSVHDPLLVINAESGRPGGVNASLRTLSDILGDSPDLDLSALEARLNSSL